MRSATLFRGHVTVSRSRLNNGFPVVVYGNILLLCEGGAFTYLCTHIAWSLHIEGVVCIAWHVGGMGVLHTHLCGHIYMYGTVHSRSWPCTHDRAAM